MRLTDLVVRVGPASLVLDVLPVWFYLCHVLWIRRACRSLGGHRQVPIRMEYGYNMQDGVVIYAPEMADNGHNIEDRRFSTDGDRLRGTDPAFDGDCAVFVGNNTSLVYYTMIHGQAWFRSGAPYKT